MAWREKPIHGKENEGTVCETLILLINSRMSDIKQSMPE